MKRTALKRKSGLQRARAAARATKPKRSKHARRDRAPSSWFEWVKSQRCIVAVFVELGTLGPMAPVELGPDQNGGGPYRGTVIITSSACSGPIDADHMGDRMKEGDGARSIDATCVGICHGHHMQRHALSGAFAFFRREDMRSFTASAIQYTQNRARDAGIEIPSC